LDRLGIIVNLLVVGKFQIVKLGIFMGCPVLKGIFWFNVGFCGESEASSSQWGSGTEAVATLGPSCSELEGQSSKRCILYATPTVNQLTETS
jgi:hypothetical protein